MDRLRYCYRVISIKNLFAVPGCIEDDMPLRHAKGGKACLAKQGPCKSHEVTT